MSQGFYINSKIFILVNPVFPIKILKSYIYKDGHHDTIDNSKKEIRNIQQWELYTYFWEI